MAMLTDAEREMSKHLEKVNRLLKERIKEHEQVLADGKPFANWTWEHTEAYHQRWLEDCKTAERVVFSEMMRINPD